MNRQITAIITKELEGWYPEAECTISIGGESIFHLTGAQLREMVLASPILEPERLPEWDELSDLDKGAVLLFLSKVDYEGESYARENYPCEFLDDSDLMAMTSSQQCDAALVYDGSAEELDDDESERLHCLALEHTRDSEATPS